MDDRFDGPFVPLGSFRDWIDLPFASTPTFIFVLGLRVQVAAKVRDESGVTGWIKAEHNLLAIAGYDDALVRLGLSRALGELWERVADWYA